MSFIYDDGGREYAGFQGAAGDCVVRAITIAASLPYSVVYDQLAEINKAVGRSRSAREGTFRKEYDPYIRACGFAWTPTMSIGSGCTVHLRADELPGGSLIARLSRHVCAVVDGVIHDTHDPSRDGTRCVYGYYLRQLPILAPGESERTTREARKDVVATFKKAA